MDKLTIDDLDLRGKRVLMRVDFNVPLAGGKVSDDNRIRAALPSIQKAIDDGARVVLMSHLGRPKGEVVESMRLAPVAQRLGELLGKPVTMAPDCVGPEVQAAVGELQAGDVLLLENLRFHPEEEANDPDFAAQLAALGDVYVNDAFGSCHRAHASVVGVPAHLRAAAGYLVRQEIEYLGGALAEPRRPFVAILGGAKVSDKIGVITNLLTKVDALIIGGAMAYTFLKAKGLEVGASRVEEDRVDDARRMLDGAQQRNIAFHLPSDHVVADKFPESPDEPVEKQVTDDAAIPQGMVGLDIGPQTVRAFTAAASEAATVVWNGPMGVFEDPRFAGGTKAVAEALASCGATSILGGGDTAAAVNAFGVADQVSHISTGGGASLEFLEGRELPGIAALNDK
ncbi:MAG: phosphoglycerate kinase [bacterium]